jgi:biotin transport system substrate-specific component
MNRTQHMVRIALFTTLTAIGAYVALPLPFTPVPFTLQLLFTLLSGLVLGSKAGALSQIIYVCLGVLGVPVFAGRNAGPGVLVGPTGGYLVGFVVAAYVTGYLNAGLKQRGWLPVWKGIVVGGVGLGIIHGLGAWWLAFALQIDLRKALALGCLPYIIPDVMKCAGALMVAEALPSTVLHRDSARQDISSPRGAN